LKEVYNSRPIGIFDSGVGGLTVLREIIKELPSESTIYLGDTARVPYGTRSPETVMRYSLENARFLMSRGIKMLVVACNTSSSISLPELERSLPIPIVGVVVPGARAAISQSKTKTVAVIGTETTINSNAYKKAIESIDRSFNVIGIACPLFVPLVEEGWLSGRVVSLVAKRYLSPLKKSKADVLILGCTHYPMIKDVIEEIVGIPLIDSASETAKEVKRILEEGKIKNNQKGKPKREFFVTDAKDKFIRIGEKFLGHPISNVSRIWIDDL
jgi:glutamate racemase